MDRVLKKEKRRIKWTIWCNGIKGSGFLILMECIGFIASLLTVGLFYFNFPFKSKVEWRDTLVLIGLISIGGAVLYHRLWYLPLNCTVLHLYKGSEGVGELDKNTEESMFYRYIRIKFLEADSIINIAGDLSWLKRQFSLHQEVVKNNPNVKIRIYYDKNKIVDKKILDLIPVYEEIENISMVNLPYDKFNSKILKGFIFNDGSPDAQLLSVCKVEEFMKCNLYNKDSNEYAFAKAFIESVDSYIHLKKSYSKIIMIGVSGLNNIGKTSLCNVLKRELGDKIIIVPDSFVQKSSYSDLQISLFCLTNQLMTFNKLREENPEARIIVFDRTPIDNFAFLNVYINSLEEKERNKWNVYFDRLKTEINGFMKLFDLIILMKPSANPYFQNKTTALPKNIRKEVVKMINSCYKKLKDENKVHEITVEKENDEDRLRKKIFAMAQEILEKINKLDS